MHKMLLMLTSMILAVTLMTGLIGCGDAGGEANTKAPVMLYIRSLNDDAPYFAEVWDSINDAISIREDVVTCLVQNQPLDPTDEGTESFYQDIICKGYEISYFRKDTGTRVPASFTGSVNVVCTVNSSIGFDIIICRASQKQMPPLIDLCDPGYDMETGLNEIHTTCRVVVWGETFAGEEVVTDPAHMTVNFACQWID
ncbi:hypothetical protein JXA80_11140 [bacterium]|nr:hypothetical protein [candidate division CSSED10-310 bacterium]